MIRHTAFSTLPSFPARATFGPVLDAWMEKKWPRDVLFNHHPVLRGWGTLSYPIPLQICHRLYNWVRGRETKCGQEIHDHGLTEEGILVEAVIMNESWRASCAMRIAADVRLVHVSSV